MCIETIYALFYSHVPIFTYWVSGVPQRCVYLFIYPSTIYTQYYIPLLFYRYILIRYSPILDLWLGTLRPVGGEMAGVGRVGGMECVSNFFKRGMKFLSTYICRYMCPQKQRGLERAHSGEACAACPGVGRAQPDSGKLWRDWGFVTHFVDEPISPQFGCRAECVDLAGCFRMSPARSLWVENWRSYGVLKNPIVKNMSYSNPRSPPAQTDYSSPPRHPDGGLQ